MDLGTENQIGSLNWFWSELEITEKTPWNIATDAEANDIEDFNAIQTALIYAYKNGWLPYSSHELNFEIIEKMANDFVSRHSLIPYIGRDLHTEQPIACLEGEMDGVHNKLAYWKNGALFAVKNTETDETIYMFLLEPEMREKLRYLTPTEMEESLSSIDNDIESEQEDRDSSGTDESG